MSAPKEPERALLFGSAELTPENDIPFVWIELSNPNPDPESAMRFALVSVEIFPFSS